AGGRHPLRRRGRRHHPAPAPGAVGAPAGRAAAAGRVPRHRDAAGAGAGADRGQRRAGGHGGAAPAERGPVAADAGGAGARHRTGRAQLQPGLAKQLCALLFDELKLPALVKTPKGQPSTNEEALEAIADLHELPRIILEYRGLAKLRSTYTDKLPEMVNPETGRVHTSYHQAGAATGRLSSSDPNLQNIPIRTDDGRRIRRAFVAPPGRKLVACDYSQIELRIMAHLSQDPGLLGAFASGADIHRATAAEVFGRPL